MLEKKLLKREHFPIETLDSTGSLKSNSSMSIIPFLHPYFVDNGIDLSLLNEELVCEIEENTNLDREKCKTRPYLNYESRTIKLGKMKIGNGYIKFPNFKDGLCLETDRITPFGPVTEDGGIYLYPKSPVVSYMTPIGFPFSDELVNEYNMTKITCQGIDYVQIQRGWSPHNLDTRDILIKNVLIGLNNALVKKNTSK